MNFALKSTFLKITALVLVVLCFVRPSAFWQIEPLFEDFTSSSHGGVPSSLAPLQSEMAFSRDTTFDALLKQELDTCKMSCFIIGTEVLSFLLGFIFLKIKYIHHTKMFRLLI